MTKGKNYTKMHGLGNDFILFSSMDCHDTADYTRLAKKLCDRHCGIGADGLIIATTSDVADICMRIINADGSEAEMCGNGIRCFADYVYRRNLVSSKEFTVETLAGIMKPVIQEIDETHSIVRVDMGEPLFTAKDIPMNLTLDKVIDYPVEIDGYTGHISVIAMGVPHAVVFVDDINNTPVTTWGPLIERHPLFPKHTNVNFVQIVGENNIKVRTWERGAGATNACGTGACAAVVVCQEKNICDGLVFVDLVQGCMAISYDKEGTNHVYMTGPAEEVFETSRYNDRLV